MKKLQKQREDLCKPVQAWDELPRDGGPAQLPIDGSLADVPSLESLASRGVQVVEGNLADDNVVDGIVAALQNTGEEKQMALADTGGDDVDMTTEEEEQMVMKDWEDFGKLVEDWPRLDGTDKKMRKKRDGQMLVKDKLEELHRLEEEVEQFVDDVCTKGENINTRHMS